MSADRAGNETDALIMGMNETELRSVVLLMHASRGPVARDLIEQTVGDVLAITRPVGSAQGPAAHGGHGRAPGGDLRPEREPGGER